MNEELIEVCKQGNLEVLKYLIEKGTNIRVDYEHALRIAVHRGYLNIVEYLVENGANIHARNEWALRWAAYFGHLHVVKYLIEQGANIHTEDVAPLRYSAGNGQVTTHFYLLQHVDKNFLFVYGSNFESFYILLYGFYYAVSLGYKENVKDYAYWDSNIGLIVCSFCF
jgi:ankyrin repeat protein